MDVVIAELGFPHFVEGLLEAFEGDVVRVESFEDGEAFLDMFFHSDGQHHPGWG